MIREVNRYLFLFLILLDELFKFWFWFTSILFILIRFDFDLSRITIHSQVMINLRIKMKSNQKSKVGESRFISNDSIALISNQKRSKENRESSWFKSCCSKNISLKLCIKLSLKMFDINRMKLSENYWVFGRVLIFGDLIVVTSDVGRRLRVAPHYHLSVPNLRKKTSPNFSELL